MFGILADTLKIATRNGNSDKRWTAPPHWTETDMRSRAEKERDAADRRQALKNVGMW